MSIHVGEMSRRGNDTSGKRLVIVGTTLVECGGDSAGGTCRISSLGTKPRQLINRRTRI